MYFPTNGIGTIHLIQANRLLAETAEAEAVLPSSFAHLNLATPEQTVILSARNHVHHITKERIQRKDNTQHRVSIRDASRTSTSPSN
jgi:hypothetical protein